MKKIKFLIFALSAACMMTSCIDDDNDELTGKAATGGLLSVNNSAIGYVVGNDGTYTASASVYQGETKTTSVDVYKQFTDAATGSSSEEILFTTITVDNTTEGSQASLSFSFKYEDLIAGLTLGGNPLPAADNALNIGDFWNLRYVSNTDVGTSVSNASATKVSVGTRFAGIYRTLEAAYYRIGSFNATAADWPAEMVIESVDATTYRVVEYFGLFNGNEWYFQIDENDVITYPDETPSGDGQSGNGQPFITCQSNPGDMTNVPCDPAVTNIVVRDDAGGADKLYMTFGYLTAGSGPREFYQVLEKIVD